MNQWKNILFTDETKVNRCDSDGKLFVPRPPSLQTANGTVSIPQWGCMLWRGVEPNYGIERIMDQHQYFHILENVLAANADEKLSFTWKLVHDNEPKHTARSVKATVIADSISVISCPACGPDLSPIENLGCAIK
ncbi:hypothetical protein Trydic_g8177 [Trypoxylus dichotomus]